jgi:hypothetical protein
MKVFISWSGKFSKECAEILSDWIKCTLQASEPWISSKDIDKGSLWFNEISDQLKDTKVGIVCLTKDNKEKPWILFESGALAKGLSANRVCTFLINLKASDIDNPLAQFNHTTPDAESMKGLLTTINKELGDKALDDRILDQVFTTYWPIFEQQFNEVIKTEPTESSESPSRSKDDILEEILYTTRTMDKRIRSLERNKDSDSFNLKRSEEEKLFKNQALKNKSFGRVFDKQIRELIREGYDPDEIAKKLGDTAPPHFIKEVATYIWEKERSLSPHQSSDE